MLQNLQLLQNEDDLNLHSSFVFNMRLTSLIMVILALTKLAVLNTEYMELWQRFIIIIIITNFTSVKINFKYDFIFSFDQ